MKTHMKGEIDPDGEINNPKELPIIKIRGVIR